LIRWGLDMRKIWDDLWDRRELSSIEDIVKYDDCYQLLKRLADLPKAHNLSILEVGCGSGIYTLSAVKDFLKHTPCNVILLDFSRHALAVAKENAQNNKVTNVNLVLADAFKLPFLDGTFDIVWNEGVNEHFEGEERRLIFNEMARVCKPGGQVIVIVPNALDPAYRLRKKFLEIQGKWEYGLEIPYSIFELKRRIKDAGLVLNRYGGCGILASIALLWSAILSVTLRKRVKKQKHHYNKGEYSKKILKRINLTIDLIFYPLSVFFGGYIGAKGIKSVQVEDI
jgi:SAM-dependent methyltransferase